MNEEKMTAGAEIYRGIFEAGKRQHYMEHVKLCRIKPKNSKRNKKK